MNKKKFRRFLSIVFQSLFGYIKNPKRVLQTLIFKSYLDKTGWYISRDAKMPLNRNKKPIPWFTYSSINFLDKRIKKGMKIFEFGSGNSTLWFAEKDCEVKTYEYNLDWFNFLKNKLPSNVDYNYTPYEKNGNYSKSIANEKTKFDLIVIDGRDRVNCAINCINYLNDKGVIIWDNSDREYYEEGLKFLKKNDFKKLEFKGHGPINIDIWETSIFYRKNNCLDI